MFDLIVIGSGAAGIMAAISAAQNSKQVLLLEKLPKLAQKLKATGGGKCNLTNTLDDEDFMSCFGKNGRFMSEALKEFNHKDLISFFESLGISCVSLDKKRYFPVSKSSQTIIDALHVKMKTLGVKIQCGSEVVDININKEKIYEIHLKSSIFYCKNIVLATGGLGYQSLGSSGDGYKFARKFGHKITPLSPAMTPLEVKETWVSHCRADTLAKVKLSINHPKYKKLSAVGDLIFTKNGIRGPVVLDFAREITPLLIEMEEVPLHVSMINDKNEEEIIKHLKSSADKSLLESLSSLLPLSISKEILKTLEIDLASRYKQIEGFKRDLLIKTLLKTPLHVKAHYGYEKAMITRGGVSLKEINPKTMQSKLQEGLYFCGEVVDLDGPCGGFNLQWAFSSGYLAGKLLS